MMRIGERADDSTGAAIDLPPPRAYYRGEMPVDSDTVPVGSEAPGFALTAIDGSEVRLSALRGRPIVLVFLRGFG